MKPSVGRIVHVITDPPRGCYAAIIVELPEVLDAQERAFLWVFPRLSDLVNMHGNLPVVLVPVPHDEAKSPGTWHWPERVE